MNVPALIASLAEANTISILVATLNGSTSGSHGHGGDPEWPAADPIRATFADVKIDAFVEKQLIGHPCTVRPIQAGGSFHERWIELQIYVTVPYASVEDAEGEYLENDPISPMGKSIIDWIWPPVGPVTFPFEGIKHAVTHVRSLGGVDRDDDFPQDSGDWWTKEIDKVIASTPLKRPLDGD